MKRTYWIQLIVLVLIISSCGNNDDDLFDNLNSLPESSEVFYLINNDRVMKWTTDGEVWTDIYITFNATQNTPNNAQFQTDGKRVYAYAGGTLYDAEKGAYYNVLGLGNNPANKADFALTNLASHILDYVTGEIKTVPHSFVQFSTFQLSSTGVDLTNVTDFVSTLSIVFANVNDGRIIYSDDDGVSWKETNTQVGGQDVSLEKVWAYGEKFYGIANGRVHHSTDAINWTEYNVDYDFIASGGDTTVNAIVSSVFAENDYVNFRLEENVTVVGGTAFSKTTLLESENDGNSWTGTEIDISGQSNDMIMNISGIYVTEINSAEKGDRSLHYSSDLENWNLIEGEKMYMEYVYQLFKAQTVR
ncbi:hypothetical protein HZR84_13875 [Hyphobacterium sp. CCMP332]|nr:hypothetical protein HZR84_13875 [Hyphobacterium sp. CCMP332]